MSIRTVRSMRSLPSLQRGLHSSSTAPKPSHLLSSQRDSIRGHYSSLTVNNLKNECRQRGLKLNGRKSDLVDRLVGFEQAQSFTSLATQEPQRATMPTAAKLQQKNFSSTKMLETPESVDTYSVPRPLVENEMKTPSVKVPVGPTAESSSPEVQTSYAKRSEAADTGASAGDVHVVDGSAKVSTMNVDLGDGAPKHEEERTGSSSSSSLPANDKTFLFGLGSVIAAWWGSQYFTKPNKTEH